MQRSVTCRAIHPHSQHEKRCNPPVLLKCDCRECKYVYIKVSPALSKGDARRGRTMFEGGLWELVVTRAPLRLSVMTSSQEGPLHSRSPVYKGVVRGQSRSRTRHRRCGRLPPSVRGGNSSWILSVATPEVRPLDATQQRSAEVADELGGQVDVFRRHVLEASECRQVVPVADHEYSERHHPKALRGLDGWGGGGAGEIRGCEAAATGDWSIRTANRFLLIIL